LNTSSLVYLGDMRLLQLRHGELNLAEFVGDNIPPYAILSHTWAQDGSEITFSDLNTERVKNMITAY
jgi:hypothetical protein